MTTETSNDRIIRLEVELKSALNAHNDMKANLKEVNDKLDDLLELRNKGIGAFWLATSLAGAGAISIFFQILNWFGLKVGVGA
jgi:hypothetical protein